MAPRKAILAPVICIALVGCAAQRDGSTGAINLALGRTASQHVDGGEAARATDGRLSPEGAAVGDGGVSLGDVRSFLVIDLGSIQPLGALRLQASATDVYFVEASADASRWWGVWTVAPLGEEPRLRTSATVLARQVEARYLRVRTTTARAAAVSEIEAYANAPRPWPPLDQSLPISVLPPFPNLSAKKLTTLYGALATLLMLAAGWNVLSRRESAGERRARRGVLAVLALVGLVAWPNLLNFHYPGAIHMWEMFHYYMGAKYFPELGYTRLYVCTLTVDSEDGVPLGPWPLRDLRGNALVPAEELLKGAAECRSRFSERRWEDFRHDARFFRKALTPNGLAAVRADHGYNATPAWAVLGGFLAGLGPASWTQIRLLALLDVALLLGIFATIGRGFGLEAACLAIGFFALNALAPFGWNGGCFLRYDWLFWLVLGVVSLPSRPAFAGFALGSSALIRVFPVCAIGGLALKALLEAASARSLKPLARHLPFAAGVAASAALFAVGPELTTGTAGVWREFAANSAKHLATPTHNLVGLPAFLAYERDADLEVMTDPLLFDRYAPWRARRVAAERNARVSHWTAVLGFLALLAFAVRGVPDWAAAILGLGLIPMLLSVSCYYYVVLLLYALLAPRSPWAGLALAALAWITDVIAGSAMSLEGQYAWASVAVVVFVCGVTAALAWKPSPGEGP